MILYEHMEALTVEQSPESPMVTDQSITNSAVRGRYKTPSQIELYNLTAKHAPEAILTLVELLRNSNVNVRLGAANTIVSKVLPNLKTVENTGTVDSRMVLQLVTYGTVDPLIAKLNSVEAVTVTEGSVTPDGVSVQATPSLTDSSTPLDVIQSDVAVGTA